MRTTENYRVLFIIEKMLHSLKNYTTFNQMENSCREFDQIFSARE